MLSVASGLRHLSLAGCPVVAGLSARQERTLVINILPGLLTLDGQSLRQRQTYIRAIQPAVSWEELVWGGGGYLGWLRTGYREFDWFLTVGGRRLGSSPCSLGSKG